MSIPQTNPSAFMVELRTSLEAATVTWALAQADRALSGRPLPEKITDLHSLERQKYENAALLALMLVNRDAAVYAEAVAGDCAFHELEEFCGAHGLDWLSDDHPLNAGDMLEMLMHRIARKAVQRYRQVLTGVYPGLSRHLTQVHLQRVTDGDPALAVDASAKEASR